MRNPIGRSIRRFGEVVLAQRTIERIRLDRPSALRADDGWGFLINLLGRVQVSERLDGAPILREMTQDSLEMIMSQVRGTMPELYSPWHHLQLAFPLPWRTSDGLHTGPEGGRPSGRPSLAILQRATLQVKHSVSFSAYYP